MKDPSTLISINVHSANQTKMIKQCKERSDGLPGGGIQASGGGCSGYDS